MKEKRKKCSTTRGEPCTGQEPSDKEEKEEEEREKKENTVKEGDAISSSALREDSSDTEQGGERYTTTTSLSLEKTYNSIL